MSVIETTTPVQDLSDADSLPEDLSLSEEFLVELKQAEEDRAVVDDMANLENESVAGDDDHGKLLSGEARRRAGQNCALRR